MIELVDERAVIDRIGREEDSCPFFEQGYMPGRVAGRVEHGQAAVAEIDYRPLGDELRRRCWPETVCRSAPSRRAACEHLRLDRRIVLGVFCGQGCRIGRISEN